MGTKVVITIDTESDNLWDPDLRKNQQFKNISELPSLQKVFDKFGARPTYLVTFSVVKCSAVGILKAISKSGNCEIGTHLHAFETPPFDRQIKGDGSYLHQYSFDAQRRKVSSIDRAIAEAFGKKPVSYRAGRYSFDGNAAALLTECGYLIDTSVTPGISWENDGGTDFKKHDYRDHFLDAEKGGLLEVPVSIKIKSLLPAISKYIYLNTPNWTHAEGILRRLTAFDIIWLDPSFNTYEEMKWACDSLLSQNVRCLNIMFHSSVIIPGGTPYTLEEKDVKYFFERLEKLLDYLLRVKKLEAMTLKEFYDFRNKTIDRSNAAINIVRLSKDGRLEKILDELRSKNVLDSRDDGFKKWHWQYTGNPASMHTAPPAWLAYSDGEIAGHLGAIPVKLKMNSRSIDAAWMVDFVTLPHHRRKGIGGLLIQEADKSYTALMTVGQTDASFSLFIKMGWKFLGDIPQYVRILHPGSLIKERSKNSPAKRILFTALAPFIKIFNRVKRPKEHKDIEVSRVGISGEDMGLFWEKIAGSYAITIPRDSAYINWKYAHQPGMNYIALRAMRDKTACGYVIVRVIKDEAAGPTGLIADILTRQDDAAAISSLLYSALKHFEHEQCSIVRCYASHRTIGRALAANGFVKHRVKMRLLINKYFDGLEEMKKMENWYLTAGDCDIDRA